ncbi:MAG: DUF4394 domain-containing protein [Gemmataceae bacterium]
MKRRSIVFAGVAIAIGIATRAPAQTVTALTSTGTLVTFNAATPGTITGTVPVSGLSAGDVLQAIDYRPIDLQLIGVGYNSTTGIGSVYTINLATGVATNINTGVLTIGTGLARVTADFNPTANALRVVTSGSPNNNFRIGTGSTGALQIDTALNPGSPSIRATAYSRNLPGGGVNGATTLYEIDSASGNLVSQGSIDFFTGSGTSPNTGTLSTVGALTGVSAASIVGFDIANVAGTAGTSQGNAYLATGTSLLSLNLTTGAATSIGTIGSGLTILDIAVVPEPGTLALCGVAAASFVGYVRRRRRE